MFLAMGAMKMRPPVALLHGWGGSFKATYVSSGWVASLISMGRDVLPLDLPGHNNPAAPINPGAYADLASALSEQLPEGPIDVVGYSLGGKLALELACRRPSRFNRLVIAGLGDNAFAPERGGQVIANALVHGNNESISPEVRDFVAYSQQSVHNPAAIAAVLRRKPNPVITTDRLSSITSIVTVINSRDDVIAQPDTALVRSIPRVTHTLISGVDHLSLMSDARVQEISLEHLKTLSCSAESSRK